MDLEPDERRVQPGGHRHHVEAALDLQPEVAALHAGRDGLPVVVLRGGCCGR